MIEGTLRLARSLCLATLIWALAATASFAATLEPIGQFDQPIFITADPGNPERLFVVERKGRVIESEAGSTSLFADLASVVSCCVGERGLLSIAIAPDFASSGRFYAAYTGKPAAGGAEGDIHVDSIVPTGGGAVAREPIISIEHSAEANHNGGQLQLGPDGYLYLSTGDGGGSGDPFESGQSLATLLGKILRLDPLPGAEPAYAIPPGNPFASGPGLDEIWSYGVRNPWRFSFDRLSGDLVIADVGQGAHEEIDHAPSPAAGVVGGSGANYGWSCREGLSPYFDAPESCPGAGGFTDPEFDYPHADPMDGSAHGCSITGGYVVRDPSLGDLYGRYVYADYCVGELRSLLLPATPGGGASGDRSEGLSVVNPVSFGEDSCGRIYVVARGGAVFRLVGDQPSSCAPPSGGGPAAGGGSEAQQGSGAQAGTTAAMGPKVRLKADRSGEVVQLVASVAPCPPAPDDWVRLNQGGRRVATKRLGDDCLAQFRRRVLTRATFRALLETDAGQTIRSRRLRVRPPVSAASAARS
ncbi:MAG TPA: PQQ-dependent sugar dehydrogenase [Solirubrobacterales bacterium]|nr:PQQ-dependent sugar dehydrogenase [Solirubrobacterales bacterium]